MLDVSKTQFYNVCGMPHTDLIDDTCSCRLGRFQVAHDGSDDSTDAKADGLFQTVPRELTLSNRVTGEIEALIVQNRLQPGDRLLAERELARQFGVSRTVIREAVRALTAKGLLEVHPGSGTIVRAPTAQNVSQSMTLYLRGSQSQHDFGKVLEVRSLLEVEIAGFAAERRTADDIDRMIATLQRIDQVVTREAFVSWDMEFHLLLAQATHNELFTLLLDSVTEAMRQLRELAFDITGAPTRAYKYHHAILEQVKIGDRKGARQAMREHLAEAEVSLKQAMALQGVRAVPDDD